MARQFRMQISAYVDMDGPELSTTCFLEHLLSCPTPKLYFCDISRVTTNYVLLSDMFKRVSEYFTAMFRRKASATMFRRKLWNSLKLRATWSTQSA